MGDKVRSKPVAYSPAKQGGAGGGPAEAGRATFPMDPFAAAEADGVAYDMHALNVA